MGKGLIYKGLLTCLLVRMIRDLHEPFLQPDNRQALLTEGGKIPCVGVFAFQVMYDFSNILKPEFAN